MHPDRLDQAVTFTMGWSGFEEHGQPTAFSADAARMLYTAHPWIRDQVLEEARDLGNFISSSSPSSASTPAPSSPAT